MNFRTLSVRSLLIAATAAVALSGCNSNAPKEEAKAAEPVSLGNEDLYEVVHDGRINVFYDR
ncbi:MAG: hypothetical protein ACPGUC_06810, partial [Gammaproteobacteria bacterium]